MPAPLTLYVDARFRSPYAMSAHVALAEKQLEFEVRLVDLAAGEQRMQPYQSRALTARVPALAHAGFHLTESSAIQEYLEDAFAPPAHPALYPAGAQARARARQVQAWLRTDLAALRRARPIDSVFDAPATTPLDDAAHCDAAKLIRVAEALLPPGQAHLFGPGASSTPNWRWRSTAWPIAATTCPRRCATTRRPNGSAPRCRHGCAITKRRAAEGGGAPATRMLRRNIVCGVIG